MFIVADFLGRGHHRTTVRHGDRKADKLTIADVCADLAISRRTFYEWRAKGRAPRCIRLPNGDLRVRLCEYQRWLAGREETTR